MGTPISGIVVLAALASAALTGCGRTERPAPFGQAEARRLVAEVSQLPHTGDALGIAEAPGRASLYLRVGDQGDDVDRALPLLVDRYVRRGLLRLQLRAVPTDDLVPGVDSTRVARIAEAAGSQGRSWEFALAYRATSPGVADVRSAWLALRYAGVVDRDRVAREAASPRVSRVLRAITRRQGRRDPPTLMVASGSDAPTPISLDDTTTSAHLAARVDRALKLTAAGSGAG